MIITIHEQPLVWLIILRVMMVTCKLMVMPRMEQTEAILAGCMVHARRKFIDAKTVQGKKKRAKLMSL